MYKCEFPCCNYSTLTRSQIHNHHIISKMDKGSNKIYNRIWLCPTHHTKIYIEDAIKGIHAIKGKDSIILIGWLSSTDGKILEYKDINNEIKYYEYK